MAEEGPGGTTKGAATTPADDPPKIVDIDTKSLDFELAGPSQKTRLDLTLEEYEIAPDEPIQAEIIKTGLSMKNVERMPTWQHSVAVSPEERQEFLKLISNPEEGGFLIDAIKGVLVKGVPDLNGQERYINQILSLQQQAKRETLDLDLTEGPGLKTGEAVATPVDIELEGTGEPILVSPPETKQPVVPVVEAPAPTPEPAKPAEEEKVPTRGVMPTDFPKKDDGFDPNYISPNSAEAMYADKARAEKERKTAEAKMTAEHGEALIENEQRDAEAAAAVPATGEAKAEASPVDLKNLLEAAKAKNLRNSEKMKKALEAQKAARAAQKAAAEAAGAKPEPPAAPVSEVPETPRVVPPDPDVSAGEFLGKQIEDATMPPMSANREDAADQEHMRELFGDDEKTPLEKKQESSKWRKKLGEAIGKLTGSAVEKTKWYASSEENLIRRRETLDTELENIKGIEKGFRWMGERYNKLGFKYKLALGVTLGVGAGISLAAASLPAIIGFTFGVAAQRAAGLATMYMKFEKASPPYGGEREKKFWQWGQREKAMGKAILYTAAMTAGMAYAMKEISETEWAHRTQEWLGDTFGKLFGHQAPAAASGASEAAPSPTTGNLPVLEQSSDEVSAGAEPAETASSMPPAMAEAVVPKAEMPVLMTHATSGKGYEFMMKRMWEDMTQVKHLDPSKFEHLKGTDFYKLLHADAKSIDQIVHDIAKDPSHGFYKPDGTSVVIHPDDVLTMGTNGRVLLMTPENIFDKAPVGELTTPVYPPVSGVPVYEAPLGPNDVPQEVAPVDLPPLESKVVPLSQSLETVNVPAADGYTPTYEGSAALAAEPAAPVPEETPVDGASADSDGKVPASETTTRPAPGEVNADFKVNVHGLSVDISHARAYLDVQGNPVIFGGSAEDARKLAMEIVSKDHSATVYFGSTEPGGVLNFFKPIHHLNKVSWFEASGRTLAEIPSESMPVEVNQPVIVNETIDSTLQGQRIPSIDDLKQEYKFKPY